MDLWIRSQDKMELRPNPKLAIEVIQGSYYVTDRYEFDKSNILGIYKTKERALEVLDEIQEFISQEDFLHIRKSSLNNLDDIAEPKYILQSCGLPKVYEMPQE